MYQHTYRGRLFLASQERYGLTPTQLRALVALVSLQNVHGDAMANAAAVRRVIGFGSIQSVRVSLLKLARLRLAEAETAGIEKFYRVTTAGRLRVGA
jgi:hypothetical protein